MSTTVSRMLERRTFSRRRGSLFAIACTMAAALAVSVPVASARHAATHVYASSFQSPYGIPAGERGLASIAVDEETGAVYLENRANGIPLEKYSADGVPTPFTAPEAGASNTISTPGGGGYRHPEVEVDNSGNPATVGRIYVISENPGVEGFLSSGHRIGGHFPFAGSARDLAIESGTGNLWVLFNFGSTSTLSEYSPEGESLGPSVEIAGYGFTKVAMDSHGTFYLTPEYGPSYKFYLPSERLEPFTEGRDIAVDPQTDDAYVLRNTLEAQIAQFGDGGGLLFEFGVPPTNYNGIPAVAINGTNGKAYRGMNGTVDIFNPGATVTLPDANTNPPTSFQATSVTLHGTVNADGEPTTDCYFEWGTGTSYGSKAPCAEGGTFSGTADQQVSADLEGLTKGTVYHYRVVAVNPNGTIGGLDESFTPSAPPTFSDEHVSDVHSDSVVLRGSVDPEGATTHYHFEYGTADCASSSCASTPVEVALLGIAPQPMSIKVTGLQPNTTYHYRLVAENQTGPSVGFDHTFTTFPLTAILKDPCANAHVRQQTGAALLLDCRAYELASAIDAGGYDVESVLVPGQEPFDGYPEAGNPSKILYAVHDGAVPGAGNPPNRGLDTYVASRGSEGWTTKYVGVPSDDPFATHSFASGLLEADQGLDAFAYGGEGICEPCFQDGSTNIPLRLPNGELVEGIAGSQSPEPAEPAGHIGKYFSADGTHFVFGTTTQLEPDGNDNGDVTIYERNLGGGTEVVATLPGGETMTGSGTGELDLSSDGSRVLVGQRVSTDADGNEYWKLYMHIAGSTHSIDLTPGTTHGVLFAGMTEDGSRVFFSTKDRLLPEDTDNSSDIYEAEVDANGTLHLSLVSVGEGGPSNGDACSPPGEWNNVSGGPDCSAVAFAGGAGVAAETGTFYFLSPEKLDMSNPEHLPVQNQANLYVVKPGRSPHFVATIDSSIGKPPPQAAQHHLASAGFVGGLGQPEAMTIDQANHDLYVNGIGGGGKVYRFNASGGSGTPDNFTAGPSPGTNTITGLGFAGGGTETQIAVDNSGGELSGDMYVANYGAPIQIFAPDGSSLGSISAPEACGVAVGEDGSVYVGSYEEAIYKYTPNSPTLPLSAGDYEKTGIQTSGVATCNVAVDDAGHVYASNWSEGPVERYDLSEFAAGTPSVNGAIVDEHSTAIAGDPISHNVFVDEGDRISEFEPNGDLVETFGEGDIGKSRGVAVDGASGRVFAANGSNVVEFEAVVPPYHPIDNPAIAHAIGQAATHTYGDFQVTADGRYAAFASVEPLTGYDNGGYSEVFRYDAEDGSTVCASCNPTNARAVGSSTLPRVGLGLAERGAVFFDSADSIAPRDLDQHVDAYEYEDGNIQLISTGASPFDSRMLGISEDGTDAYFFTRDALVPQDENGDLVKVYDARAGGGFPYIEPEPPCKASDECHGPGTLTPPPPDIRTIRGSGGDEGEATPPSCKRHFVKRHGRCVKVRHSNHRRHRRREQRHIAPRRG